MQRRAGTLRPAVNLTARGWKLTGAGMSNAGSYVTNPGYSQPNVNDSVPVTNSFTEFYNEQNGTNYTFPQLQLLYDSLCGKVLNLDSIAPPPTPAGELLCGKTEPGSPEVTLFQPDACSDSTQLIAITATEIYRAYKDSLLHHFTEAYTKKCLEAGALESFTVTRPVSEYHYTLYYYDQSGNLVKTVPPAGVHPNRNTEWLAQVKVKRLAGEEQTPEHSLPTIYRYNSLNQVVSQQSPDGGLSEFWYDRLGRLAVSRNAKQVNDDWYSFTRYDHLGRITEVGEKKQATAMTSIISRNETDLTNWLNTNYTEGGNLYRARQVTQTVYDILSPVITPGFELYPRFHQKAHTLRNRVSFTRHYEKLPVSGGNVQYGEYTSASHYSYDIHGNVDTLLQDYRNGLMAAHGSYSESANNRFKLMAYHYDLISGKVNQVHYQPDEQDALYHRYEYDAENRLTDVYTTTVKDFVGFPSLEEREAVYQYYKHGPLARTILGQQQVQGIDYAYTLQGWLKGVNSASLNPVHDIGNDSHPEYGNGLVAKDVYGFQLNYYTGLHGDYTAINRDKNPFPRHAAFMPINEDRQLYNGNISSMVVNIPRLGGPQLYNYKYDQLNRIVAMDLYRGLDVVNNTWNNDNQELVVLQDYKERISYDANGNILTYLRNGTTAGGRPLAMDELTYGYNKDGNNNLINNRLRHVKDAIGNENYEEDIDNQADDNYDYDAIGNLIKDVKEGIDNIEWTVYGKISSIEKTDGTVINYTYDVAGNRISKSVTKSGTTETSWYVRDASGNVMALYTHKGATLEAEGLKLAEQHLYGSSRLGIWNRDVDMDNAPANSSNESLVGTAWLANFSRGKKFFELTNHLGNVLVTVSDRKTILEWDEDMANGDCVPGSAIDVLDVDTRGEETSYIGRTEVNLLPGFESGSADEFVAYTDDALDVCVPQSGGGSTEPFYAAEVVSANDYYPFGMVMPGRRYSAGNQYRYGFNGKENDNEVKGEGNQQDYGMRIYDPRLGKFLSVDPLTKDFPWYTPYQFAGNTPIQAVDLDGAEPTGYSFNHPYVASHSGSSVKFIPSSYDGKVYEHRDLGLVTAYAVQDVDKKCYLIFESATGAKKQYWYREYDNSGWKGNVNSFAWQTPPDPSKVLTAITVGPIVAIPALIVGGFGLGSGALWGAISSKATVGATNAVLAYYRYAPIAGAIGRGIAEFLDETGTIGASNQAGARVISSAFQEGKGLIGGMFKLDNGKTFEVLAEKVIEAEGKTLHMKNIIGYIEGMMDNDKIKNTVKEGMKDVLEKLKENAKSQGYEKLRISGHRAENSTSKNPGHTFDYTIDL